LQWSVTPGAEKSSCNAKTFPAGLRFKSTSKYMEQTLIEVAARTVPGSLPSSFRPRLSTCRSFRSKIAESHVPVRICDRIDLMGSEFR